MKYFNVFLNEGNSEVHGQILYINTLIRSSQEFIHTFSHQYTEKIRSIYAEPGFYIDFDYLTNMIKH